MIDCYNRPLKTVCFARIPIHLGLSDDALELVLNILEKLGTLLFQTLPAKTLHQFEIEPKFPNIHCNVLSPLLQSQGNRLEATYIKKAITFLQETDNPEILQYYQEHARQDPLKTLIMERALEKRGGVAHTYETLPESIKNYLSPKGFTNKNEVEAMIAPGATLVLFILMIMSSLGNATKHALNDDEYVKHALNDDQYAKQYRLQETYENYDSSSVLAPLMRGSPGTYPKIVDLICSQCRTVRKKELNHQYERTTGRFILRKYRSNKCDTDRRTFVPVNPLMRYTSSTNLNNRRRREAKLEAKANESRFHV